MSLDTDGNPLLQMTGLPPFTAIRPEHADQRQAKRHCQASTLAVAGRLHPQGSGISKHETHQDQTPDPEQLVVRLAASGFAESQEIRHRPGVVVRGFLPQLECTGRSEGIVDVVEGLVEDQPEMVPASALLSQDQISVIHVRGVLLLECEPPLAPHFRSAIGMLVYEVLEIVDETARYLGVGITSLLHTIDPEGVLLGGAMTFGGKRTELGRRFLAEIKEEIDRRAFPLLAERITLEFASLGGEAGYIGAAGIARLEHREAVGRDT